MHYRTFVAMIGAAFICIAGQAQDSLGVENSLRKGKNLYETHCLSCHQADGTGIPNLAPPLVHGEFVNGDTRKLIGIVLHGMEGVEINGETYFNPMPSFDYLTNEQIADVLTYVRNNFENEGGTVSVREVERARQ